MKIRKAFAKAKEKREQGEDGFDLTSPSTRKPPERQVDQPTWIPPVYAQSSHVSLDKDTVRANRCICIDQDPPELESYKILRERLLQCGESQGGKNIIMVTSARKGEGKTVTAINLAFTFARQFHQTSLLVDCDLRKQDIHRYLGYESDKSLVDYIKHGKSMHDLIVWPGIDKLTIVSGRSTMSGSSELLGAPRMKKLVNEMKNRYDDRYVILDVPAVLDSADALTFAPLVDCIVVVVEKGRTSIKEVKDALDMLPTKKIVGFVLNERQG